MLKNDDDGNGAPTDVELTSEAGHGTAVVSGASGISGASTSSVQSGVAQATAALATTTSRAAVPAAASGSQTIIYTPDADFTGTDTFDYVLITGNGKADATVNIKVAGGQVVEVDGVLPDTGSPDAGLLGYAALLLAGGGWLVTRGRRRSEHDHLVG